MQAAPIDNRVLIYNNIGSFALSPTAEVPQGIRCPVCAGTPQTAPASVVLGQADFVSIGTSQPPTASGFRTPTGVASDGKISGGYRIPTTTVC